MSISFGKSLNGASWNYPVERKAGGGVNERPGAGEPISEVICRLWGSPGAVNSGTWSRKYRHVACADLRAMRRFNRKEYHEIEMGRWCRSFCATLLRQDTGTGWD